MYEKENTGALYFNDRRTLDNQPHYRGSINIEGVKYGIGAWRYAGIPDNYTESWKGILFDNPDKSSEKHPDMVGVIHTLQGKYLISAWKRVSKANNDYFSVSIKPFDERYWKGSFPDDCFSIGIQKWIEK